MNRFNRDQILGLIRESKSQAKRGKVSESIRILESLPKELFSPSNDIGWRVVSQMVTHYNKLSFSSADRLQPLKKAENCLLEWICTCHKEQRPIKEKLVRLLLMTASNLSLIHI